MDRLLRSYIVPGCCLVVLGLAAWAQEPGVQGTLLDLDGTVEAYRASDGQWIGAEKGMLYQERDALSTAEKSWALIEFQEKHQIKMKENTELTIRQLYKRADTGEEGTVLDLSVGEILNRVQKLPTEGSIYTIHTPTATSSVRGTIWGVKVYKKDGQSVTEVRVLEGVVDVTDQTGKVLQLTDGEETEISELGVSDSATKMDSAAQSEMRADAQTLTAAEEGIEEEALDLEGQADLLENNVEDTIESIETEIEKPLEQSDDDDNDRDLIR